MTWIGNHLKVSVLASHRPRVREFYLDVLRCAEMKSPISDLDLFLFEGGFVLGVFYCENAADVLDETEQRKGAWLEIKAKNVEALKHRLKKFGVREVDYVDTARMYFQAPGGQVFRLAPMDGGL